MQSILWFIVVGTVIITYVDSTETNSVEDLHIEKIKKKILAQLHFLSRPPRDDKDLNVVVPRPALEVDKTNEDEKEEDTIQIILLSETHSTLTHTFSIKTSVLKRGNIDHATLSVYKMDGTHKKGVETVTLKQGNRVIQRKTFPVTFYGWITFDVGNILQYHEKDKITFSFHCDQCNRADDFITTTGTKYTPYLTINASLTRHKIIRRSTTLCADKEACCLQYLYVNFTEIGWNDWVKEPNGFVANYCGGKCSQSQPKKELSLKKLAGHIPLSSCCIATEQSPLTLYFHRNMVIYKKVFKDLVTTKCGCT